MNPTTLPPQNPALGFGMAGMGADVARVVANVCERFDEITYLEIGVGYGITLAELANLFRLYGVKWRAIGVDKPDGYSYDATQFRNNMERKQLAFAIAPENPVPEWDKVTLYQASSIEYLPGWSQPLQLALIDACHCRQCATADFLNIEPHIVPGGVVLFHDMGTDQIGQGQPHNFVDVDGAVRDLGLLGETRPGWKHLETLIGLKAEGSGDMGVFQKE